jgi:hypothetical protein
MWKMVDCKYPVGKAGPQQGNQDILFAWTDTAECGDRTIVDWTVKRQFLLTDFLEKLATWGIQHYRKPSCGLTNTWMKITEHGVTAVDPLSQYPGSSW